MSACPICKDDLAGRERCHSAYCEGYRDGRGDGQDETARAFWRAVCAERAVRFDDAAAREMAVYIRAAADDAFYKHEHQNMGITSRLKHAADVMRGEAALLRKWASE